MVWKNKRAIRKRLTLITLRSVTQSGIKVCMQQERFAIASGLRLAWRGFIIPQ